MARAAGGCAPSAARATTYSSQRPGTTSSPGGPLAAQRRTRASVTYKTGFPRRLAVLMYQPNPGVGLGTSPRRARPLDAQRRTHAGINPKTEHVCGRLPENSLRGNRHEAGALESGRALL